MIDFIRIQHIQSGLKFKRFRFHLINSIKSVTQFKCRKENEQKCWTIWPFFLSLSLFAHFLASEINQHYGKNDFGFLCAIEFLLGKNLFQFLQSGSHNLFSVGNVFALFLNRILSAVDYLTYVITNILLLQWQLSLFSFILMCFFLRSLYLTHTLSLSLCRSEKGMHFKNTKKIQNQCVWRWIKSTKRKWMKFFLWNSTPGPLYINSSCICHILCTALSFFQKKAKEKIPTKCWLGFNELFYILGMRRALLSDCTGSSMWLLHFCFKLNVSHVKWMNE